MGTHLGRFDLGHKKGVGDCPQLHNTLILTRTARGCHFSTNIGKVARLTGLEPATLGVTGRYSNQLSYNRVVVIYCHMVETSGLEPPTFRLSGECSNQLSYVSVSWCEIRDSNS